MKETSNCIIENDNFFGMELMTIKSATLTSLFSLPTKEREGPFARLERARWRNHYRYTISREMLQKCARTWRLPTLRVRSSTRHPSRLRSRLRSLATPIIIINRWRFEYGVSTPSAFSTLFASTILPIQHNPSNNKLNKCYSIYILSKTFVLWCYSIGNCYCNE